MSSVKTVLCCPEGKLLQFPLPYTAEKFQYRALWSAWCDSLKGFDYQQGAGRELGVAGKHELFTGVWKLPIEMYWLIFSKKKELCFDLIVCLKLFAMFFIAVYSKCFQCFIFEYIELRLVADLFMTVKVAQRVRLSQGRVGQFSSDPWRMCGGWNQTGWQSSLFHHTLFPSMTSELSLTPSLQPLET